VVKPAEPRPAPESAVKVLNLFDAYAQEKLPRDRGYIVSSFFKETPAYSIYEIVSYSGVKEISNLGNGLQFVSNIRKLYILVEPSTYNEKHIEPVHRKEGETIPYRESELDIIRTIDQTRIMVARKPMEVSSPFTILKPTGSNVAVVFPDLPDTYQKLAAFFKDSLRDKRIPPHDAEQAAELIARTVKTTMSF
jgi:hypothetical protein